VLSKDQLYFKLQLHFTIATLKLTRKDKNMTIEQYITKINTLFQTGNAREHSYRGFAESFNGYFARCFLQMSPQEWLVAHLIMY
jgi:hypothetical protein